MNDFPKIENIAKKKIKIAVLLKEKTVIDYKKKFQKNSQKLAENNDLYKFKHSFRNMSPKSEKCLKYYLINFFKNPILYSIVLQFIVTYEYYYQLFKYLGIKIYANSILDMSIAPKRQALKDLGATNISFQHSYFEKTVFLSQPNDIVFSWGKDIEDSINIKDNFIEKLVNIYPSYIKYSKNSKSEYKKFLIKIKKKKKIITFFDSNMYETGWINPKDYNIILKILLSKINNSNNLFLVLKLKYSDHSKYINSENLKLINKLAKNNNLILIKKISK